MAVRLLASGASVNARGLDDDTPLHDASSNGHVRLVKLLVEKGADINVKNKRGKTPLDVAAAGIQQYLLNPNLPPSGMLTYIFFCCLRAILFNPFIQRGVYSVIICFYLLKSQKYSHF